MTERKPAQSDVEARPTFEDVIARVIREELRKMSFRQKRNLDYDEAAEYLGVSVGSIYNLVAARSLHNVNLPGIKKRLIDIEELDRLIESGKCA